MEDWPQAPELFLMHRGWTQPEPNVWLEPLSRCMGPIPEGVHLGQSWKYYRGPTGNEIPSEPMARVAGMIEDAEAKVLAERRWIASETLKRMPKGNELLHDGHQDSGGQAKVRDGDYRDPQAEAVEHLRKAEEELDRLLAIKEAGGLVKVREQGRCDEHTAVRHELNLSVGPTPVIRREEPKWTEEQIQNMLPAAEKANNAPRVGSNIPKTYDVPGGVGKPRQIFADERRLRNETQTVNYEACPVCRKYPAKLAIK
jgi:hypothetical protein